MSKRLSWDNEHEVAQLVTFLCDENISICTTDTVLGFLAKASKATFDKINAIKGRSKKPYLILVSSPAMVVQFAEINDKKIQNLINEAWPGPLTLILKAKKTVPLFMRSSNNAIALRMPAHKGLLSVTSRVGPMFSTSANLAGEPVPIKIDEIDSSILEQINYIISNGKEEGRYLPSTILDCTDPEDIGVLREGAYPVKKLALILGETLRK